MSFSRICPKPSTIRSSLPSVAVSCLKSAASAADFRVPRRKTQDEFITEEAYKGLKERMEAQVYFKGMTEEERREIDEKYYARLDYELSVIKKWVFPATS